MKQYAAFITGEGEGCDYTIGCNKNFCLVTAINEKDALNKILESYGQLNPEGDYDIWLDVIEMFEVTKSWGFTGLADIGRKKYDEFKRNKKEDDEKKELERLKKKYEGETK